MFQLKYVPQQEQHLLLKITGMNSSTMPPCHNVLVNKVKRANFVSAMWKKACTPQPVIISPVDNGWILQDDTYIVNGMTVIRCHVYSQMSLLMIHLEKNMLTMAMM